MSRHAKPDEPEDQAPEPEPAPPAPEPPPAPKPRLHRRLFQDKYLPHWVFWAFAAIWAFFQFKLGDAGVPPTLNQVFGAVSGLYTAYVFRLATLATSSADEKGGGRAS